MKLRNLILDSLFPPHCLGCGTNTESENSVLCPGCLKTLPRANTLFCATCEARLPLGKKICHKDAPYILGSLTRYDSPLVKKLIGALKFKHLEMVGTFLGEQLAIYAETLNPLPEILSRKNTIVIPIPLSRARLRERGYDQATVIARTFANHTKLPMREDALKRTRNTAPQSLAENKKEREENLRGAFTVLQPEIVRNQSVILVDDVVTTGATLRSAAQTLKENGVKTILALTIAR